MWKLVESVVSSDRLRGHNSNVGLAISREMDYLLFRKLEYIF
jgi:hypothetical protein